MNADLEKRMRDLGMRLRAAQDEVERLEIERVGLVGELIDAGYTTYKVAELAGVKQPRIVQINNIAKGGTALRSPAPRGASNQPRNNLLRDQQGGKK